MLSFGDLVAGDRIVVRYRLEQSQEGEKFSDALGEVQEITDDSISVKTRSEVVIIARSSITHAKRVPPPPPRRRPRT
ncbi:hypothetical protein [Glutamicibacter sp. JC586]|uniref:putative acetyltransferase n=1 Tax=Glutamicibacter sp. JC586 TaxID=2590552 RepID=UPI0013596711|nr:hypothetical protein [Glutamicibacter sp. JC586]